MARKAKSRSLFDLYPGIGSGAAMERKDTGKQQRRTRQHALSQMRFF